ncbi:MAG: ferrous iron transport protein B [Oscillospiraceae bacterium]|nr:ferrous iron transport protein B [Oscillospiraceae bacterium]
MAIKIALAGNPNSGKTTMFNALTGSNQFVGNWPGVTVEKKEGRLKGDRNVVLIDLPGAYSLSPYTMEESLARDYLMNGRPDAILNLVDGTNLERNLYLTTQLRELDIPVVIALNMMDVVEKKGDLIDIDKLSIELGCEIIRVSALRGTGVDEAAQAAVRAANARKTTPPGPVFSGSVEHALAHIEEAVLHDLPENRQRFYAIKLFERDKKIVQSLKVDRNILGHIERDIKKCETQMDDDAESIIANERYNYIESIVKHCLKRKQRNRLGASDRIDSILTNRFLALPIFAVIMFLVYFISVTAVGGWASGWINGVLLGQMIPDAAGSFLTNVNAAGWLQSLILDGMLAGVGSVLGFVPQIFVLFFILAFLESCGYMSRIAFILDKIFRRFGLSGKSFIPMLVGTGCSVPGIMASRTIENEQDRRMTVITTSFMPCSAKLPLIALIAASLFGGAWWVGPSAYFIGIASIVISGLILKKTRLLRGKPAPFVMELPAYHMPPLKNLLRSTWERGWSFIKKAGTLILLSAMVIWFTYNFGFVGGRFTMVSDLSQGLLSKAGGAVAWFFAPLGFGNWQSAVATFTGLAAKENVVSTLGVLLEGAETEQATASQVTASQAAASLFTAASAYSFLVFNLLCTPCAAAVGAIRREMNSAKWTLFALAYQTGFAYAVSLCIYQFASLGNGTFGLGSVAALFVTAFFLYVIFKPNKGEV